MEKQNPLRSVLVTLALALLLGAVIFLVLSAAGLGFFGIGLLTFMFFALICFLHYATWGYAMTEEVAQEREEMIQQEQAEMHREDEKRQEQAVQDLSLRHRYERRD